MDKYLGVKAKQYEVKLEKRTKIEMINLCEKKLCLWMYGPFFYNQLKIQSTKNTTTVPIMARIDTRSSKFPP